MTFDDVKEYLKTQANTEETIEQYIRNSEEHFSMKPVDLNNVTLTWLKGYVEYLDWLWLK